MKNKKIPYLTIITGIAFFALGIIFGIMIQQQIMVASVEKIIGYTDVDIVLNFNETKFTSEFNETVVPEFKDVLSDEIKKQEASE